eukprot:g333.t1
MHGRTSRNGFGWDNKWHTQHIRGISKRLKKLDDVRSFQPHSVSKVKGAAARPRSAPRARRKLKGAGRKRVRRKVPQMTFTAPPFVRTVDNSYSSRGVKAAQRRGLRPQSAHSGAVIAGKGYNSPLTDEVYRRGFESASAEERRMNMSKSDVFVNSRQGDIEILSAPSRIKPSPSMKSSSHNDFASMKKKTSRPKSVNAIYTRFVEMLALNYDADAHPQILESALKDAMELQERIMLSEDYRS